MAEKYVSCNDLRNALYDADAVTMRGVAIINGFPAADVVAVRHASWIEDGYYNKPCVCSNCGEPCKDTVMGKPRWDYCPSCGAKMDGGNGDG